MTFKMGVVGLGVMGGNLARNIESRGLPVAGYDLSPEKTKAFLEGPAKGKAIIGVDRPERLMEALERPRRVLMMVPAGPPVDSVIAHLKPHLQEGDILIDGGNSHFADTDRRSDELAAGGFRFMGTGVSGGEEGALHGPAIMPGGPREGWEALAPVFRAIAARAEEDGEPCVDYMGPRGAGHYVKMVHNGIEYGDMQLIAEVYDVLHRGAGLPTGELARLFAEWNRGELKSYLIEITALVLERVDEQTGQPLVDMILDEAQQKGTGKWMSQNAFDVGAPIPTVNAAVEARILSALKS
jgi:6-phosphogluconate dehydrogenase